MGYKERISSISNLTMDAIIENCRSHIPDKYRYQPYNHIELNHGLDLLSSDEGLDCYIGAYGEMHQAKCRGAMQNMPFPPKNISSDSLSLEIVDWGCGQGIGAICLIDFLKERELTRWLKKITLIEPSMASLNRALANVTKATYNSVQVITLNKYLPSVSDDVEADSIHFEQRYVFHIFSNILDVTQINLAKLAKSIAVPGHTHYILCMGPLNATAFRIDRFCDIFQPNSFFSDISSKNYGRTTDTNHSYTCKTKGFIYEGTSLDLSKYNPYETANLPIYGEYDVNLHIQNKWLSYNSGCVYWHLQRILASNDILYINPEINGSIPDFVIVRPNVGILIINVFEEVISKCNIDESGLISISDDNGICRVIDSPISALEVSQNLVIESIREFTEAVIEDNRNLGLVKRVLICSNGTSNEFIEKFGAPNYVNVYGSDFISVNSKVPDRLFEDTRFHFHSPYFDEAVLNRLKMTLSPKWHTFREGQEMKLSTQQRNLSKSVAGAQQKISGVAGAGKTQVLATRAVNAQVRTGGVVLVLTFNITLANYMRMRIGQVRADFPWDKINIDYYHRFFRKHANVNNLHVYFESYDNIDFFESVKDKLPKYDAILIDEVQDYLTNWLQLLKQYFLKDGGEFVVFGDPKQNIYHRELDREGNVKLGIIPGRWNKELSKGRRFTNPSLASLATDFQKTYLQIVKTAASDSLVADNKGVGFQFNLLKYAHLLQPAENVKTEHYIEVYNLCLKIIEDNNLDHKDVAIIAPQTEILRFIDARYRLEYSRKTTVTFVRKEMLEKISRQAGQASYEFKRDYDRLEKVQKNKFTMQTRYLKLSTIQSFKGWEAPTIICIILDDMDNDENIATSPELIYTGITRAKENLIVINIGENRYHNFFSSKLQSI